MLIVVVTGVLALLWVIFSPWSGLWLFMEKKAELRELQSNSVKLGQDNSSLKKEIERLRSDPSSLEKIARKKYNLLKKNERVYDFSQPDKRR